MKISERARLFFFCLGSNFHDSWVNQLTYASSKTASSVASLFLSTHLRGYTSVQVLLKPKAFNA